MTNKMVVLIILFCILLVHPIHAETSVNEIKTAIVIFSQDNEYHENLFQLKKENIEKQAKDFPEFHTQIFNSYHLLGSEVGHWTIFPLIELGIFKDFHWILFLEELTSINLEKVIYVLSKYNVSQDIFVGYALQDIEPTIIHHFAEPNLLYPHLHAGFFISSNLVQRLASYLPVGDKYSFSIDAKYELAKFIRDSCDGVRVQDESQFCLIKTSENCATWVDEEFPDCGGSIPTAELLVGVKTCHKFHSTRISVVKNTWASETDNLLIFSDKEDKLISTVKVPVKNVNHGHCEKTLAIMKYYLNKESSFSWLIIVDDDTIISITRLQKLLSCYNSSDTVAIGERYGYSSANTLGYDYITGGGGMIFSQPTLKFLVKHCHCPSIDSPDDMIIGMCLKRLGIPITHLPYFHQARPIDYSEDFLKPFKHVSFHKHWMIDPYSVYKEWLQDTSSSHSEL